MSRTMRWLPVFLVAVLTLAVGIAAPQASAQNIIPFDEAEIFFEENATDGDLGIQFFLDGEAWRRITIWSPDWQRLIDIEVNGSVGVIGLTEFFSESAEPSFDEVPRDQFLALFPTGDYFYFGQTIDGRWLIGTASLTQNLPDAPRIVSPVEDDEIDPNAPFVVQWDLVPDPPGSEIVAYHIVVEKDEEDERVRVFSVDMPSTSTSVTVPREFFEPGKEYKVEVIAIGATGNRTITEVSFETTDD